jgi:hypothetical protein
MRIAGSHAQIEVHPLFPAQLPPGLPADFPEGMHVEEKSGLKDHDVKHPDTYYAFEPPGKTDQTTFVVALILSEPAKQEPSVQRFQDSNMEGVRITQSGMVTEVYVNTLAEGRIRHRNSVAEANGWDTDAYLTALTFPEKADRSKAENISGLFVADGSFLRYNGTVVYDSLSKVFMNVAYSPGKLDVLLEGQSVINLSVLPGRGNEEITVNGERISHSDTPRDGLLRISLKQ